jgi:hypothetical protein
MLTSAETSEEPCTSASAYSFDASSMNCLYGFCRLYPVKVVWRGPDAAERARLPPTASAPASLRIARHVA